MCTCRPETSLLSESHALAHRDTLSFVHGKICDISSGIHVAFVL